MDTVEKLGGTYFDKGMFNLTAGELFSSYFWMRLKTTRCRGYSHFSTYNSRATNSNGAGKTGWDYEGDVDLECKPPRLIEHKSEPLADSYN